MKFFLRTRSIRVAALAVVSGTAGLASLTALSGPSAQADPVSTTAEVGVGADVPQDVFDGLTGASAPGTATTQFFTPLHASTANDNRPSSPSMPSRRWHDHHPGLRHHQAGWAGLRPAQLHHQRPRRPHDASPAPAGRTPRHLCTNAPVNVVGQFDFARAARGPRSPGARPHLHPLRP